MRSRHPGDDHVADVTRRRLAALSAELAAARGEPAPEVPVTGGSTTPDEPPVTGRHARGSLPVWRRVSGWLADRLPSGLHGRAHLGSAQVGVVCLVVAVGLAVGAWWLVRAGGVGGQGEVVPPRAAVVPAPSSPAPSPSPPSAGEVAPGPSAPPAVAGSGEGQIVVDVVGKVRRPGIAVLPTGSRVVDAVRAAGGVRRGVDRTEVNMARPLTDGEQVVIGLASEGGSAGGPVGVQPTAPGGAALVNLNTADQAELETLPGVGPVTAGAILEWRAEHGAFTAVEELLEVSGIGDATLAEIAPHVTL